MISQAELSTWLLDTLKTSGFPAACVVALGWFIRTELREYRIAIDNNRIALERMSRILLLHTIARGNEFEKEAGEEILAELDDAQKRNT